MDTLELIGQPAPPNAGRDAIHIAVIPQKATATLVPGQAILDEHGSWLGVVDPFLDRTIVNGEWYWLFLKPATIHSLRHVWTHPSFVDEVTAQETVDLERVAAMQWLQRRGMDLGGFTAREVIETTRMSLDDKDGYVCFGSDIDGDREINEEFWRHYEIATGTKVDRKTAPTSFRCAC